jgi:CRP/FNR family cyclic AMP-dependent transcriptional regulator
MYVGWPTSPDPPNNRAMPPIKTEHDHLVNGLSLVPWNVLDQLTPEQLRALDQTGTTRKLGKGDFVFRSGENAAGVYFLKSGKIKVSQPVSNGKEVILWFCFGGDIFGLAEAAQHGEREVSAQACETSEVLSIPQARFNAYLFEYPQVMFLLLQVMSSRLRCLSETLANVAGEQVHTRLARLMLWLCARYGRREGAGIIMNVHLTHQEIADMIGATRQTVTSIMSDFKRKGILDTRDHYIHIVDKTQLGALLH